MSSQTREIMKRKLLFKSTKKKTKYNKNPKLHKMSNRKRNNSNFKCVKRKGRSQSRTFYSNSKMSKDALQAIRHAIQNL